MKNLPGSIGKSVITKISTYTGLLSLLYYSFIRLFKFDPKGRYYFYDITIKQIYFTGVQAATIIGIIALALGVVIIFQLNSFLANLGFGLQEKLGEILVIVVVRELGPLLTTIIIIARSGTAIATEIGNMVMNHEIEALETLGIDTLYFLVLPRILGMVISLAVLNTYFTVVCIIGGVSIAFALDPQLSLSYIMNSFLDNLSFFDISESIIKAVFFGCGIAVICTINGFKALTFPGGVPVAGINGVVGSLIYVFFMNTILTVLFLYPF